MTKKNHSIHNNLISLLDNIIYLNIKTSGINPIEDKILEISAIKIKNNKIDVFNKDNLRKYSSLVDIKDELVKFLGKEIIICHNSFFIKGFIDYNIPQIKNKFIDSMELAIMLEPYHKEYSLQYLKEVLLYERENIENKAIYSCIDNIKIVNALLIRLREKESATLEPLTFKINTYLNNYNLSKWEWANLIDNANYNQDVEYVISINSIKIDKKYENNKERYIINQLIKKERCYEELLKDKDIWKSKEGFMYEYRPGQYELTKTIRETLKNSGKTYNIACIEAPTGIGKSVGYLLSAILEARVNKKRIIISTDTKELQIQLINKDIPNVLSSLGLNNKVSYGYIKGKNNYICVEKLEHYKKDYEPQKNKKLEVLSILILERLVEDGLYGDIEEISNDITNYFNIDNHIRYISCDPNLCRPKKCYKNCLYKKRVEELKDEDITIINHSLLAKWPYKEEKPLEHIIVDEGHNLAEKGYDFFASTIEYKLLSHFLQEIYPYEYIKTSPFYFNQNNKRLGKIKVFDKFYHHVHFDREIKNKISRSINLVIEEMNSILEYGMISDYSKIVNYNLNWELNLQSKEIAGKIRNYEEYLEISYENYSEKIKNSCENIIRNLISILLIMDRNIDEDTIDKESDVYKFGKARIKELEDIKSTFELLLEYSENDDFARIIEIDKNFRNFEFRVVPLKLAQLFEENILSQLQSGIFLSATLSVENNMNYFKNTLGINRVSNIEKVIKPLYDYKNRVSIIGVNDICTYKDKEFPNEMGKIISNIGKITDGHILSLFNSKDRQEKTYDILKSNFNIGNMEVYINKKGIKYLKDINRKCIVLGSKGCFEGVDIPGDGLICVTLDKIPNLNPKDPLYSTIMKKYNIPYYKLNYPQMTIKLKQAMGRLLRSKYDYGCFIIFNIGTNLNSLKRLERDLHGCSIMSISEIKLYDYINTHLYKCRKYIINDALYDMKKILNYNKESNIYNIKQYLNEGFKIRSIKSNVSFLEGEENILKISYFNQKYLIDKEKLKS